MIVFAHGQLIYLRAWFGAFTREGRRAAPLTPQRLAVLLLGMPLFMLLQLVHAALWLLDALLFPRWRSVGIVAPVFITGIPRSGTTYVHRRLALDDAQFSTPQLWELVLAPSISARYLLRGLSRLDRWIGAPLHRGLAHALRRIDGDFAAIHEVGPWAAEEDYLALLPVAGCFLLVLMFPHDARLWSLAALDRWPPRRRARLLAHYRACLQKHLYVRGGGRRLLSKNAAFASWLPALRETFPDGRFIVCTREPLGALSSQLSAIVAGRRLFATDPDGRTFAARFGNMFEHAYALLADALRDAPPGQVACIDQQALARAPGATLLATLASLDIRLSAQAAAALSAQQHAHRSAHRHRAADHGLDATSLGARLGDDYRRLRRRAVPDPSAVNGVPLE